MVTVPKPKNNRQLTTITWLIAGFAMAIALRVSLGVPDVAHSALAGLAFAGALLILSLAAGNIGWPPRRPAKVLLAGIGGAAVLCIPPFVQALIHGSHHPAGNYLAWSLIVTIVASSEELFLRGALYSRLAQWRGPGVAIAVGTLLFGLLHLPLYGLASLPLNLAVGVWLGLLRHYTGSWLAPATAHVLADLAGWWLV